MKDRMPDPAWFMVALIALMFAGMITAGTLAVIGWGDRRACRIDGGRIEWTTQNEREEWRCVRAEVHP